MDIKRLLQLGYYPVSAELVKAGDGAQRVDGQWYMPRWGPDTLNHIDEIWGNDEPQERAFYEPCRGYCSGRS